MSEAFRETTPQEAQMAVLQFMGQHLTGDLKELERNLVSRNTTLAGMTLNPENVIRSIPAPVVHQSVPQYVQPAPPPQPVHIPLVAPEPVQQVQPQEAPKLVQEPTVTDENQLEFNFNTSPYTVRVFEKIESIEKKVQVILDVQGKILSLVQDLIDNNKSIENIKKKDI